MGDMAPMQYRAKVLVECQQLSKSFGHYKAVQDLSFTLQPGQVTGFLGPNGSGKSTTMRLMLGLDHGQGNTLFDGKPLATYERPARVVGAHLDAKFFHPKRTARNHLRMLAAASAVSDRRVDEVIDLVGLGDAARKQPRGFSLGMGQRLGLAGALLSDPAVLLLDEPANGLDPQSISWLRDFIGHYAGQDRVVLVSSHLLSEMQLLANHLVVIGRGKLIADESLADFVSRSTRNDVFVRTPNSDALIAALTDRGLQAVRDGAGISVPGADTELVGAVAFSCGAELHELTRRTASLEEAFLEVTSQAQEFTMGGHDDEATTGGAQ